MVKSWTSCQIVVKSGEKSPFDESSDHSGGILKNFNSRTASQVKKWKQIHVYDNMCILKISGGDSEYAVRDRDSSAYASLQ